MKYVQLLTRLCLTLWSLIWNFREADEIDDQIREISKEVSKFAFPEHGVPTADTVLTGFKDIISDNLFNAAGSITARKIAHKARTTFSKQTDYSKKATLQQLNSKELLLAITWAAIQLLLT